MILLYVKVGIKGKKGKDYSKMVICRRFKWHALTFVYRFVRKGCIK